MKRSIPILFLALISMATTAFRPAGENGYDIGDVVTDFALTNVDGEAVSLADYPDTKGFIVVFTCNTCPYAVAYEDRIIELDNAYRELGYPVVAINPNDAERKPGDSFEAMVTQAEEHAYPFPYLHDADQSVAKQFGATRTPHIYLLQRNNAGKLRVAFIGAIDDAPYAPEQAEEHWVKKAIESLEAGELPEPAKVKAIGCTIKWSES